MNMVNFVRQYYGVDRMVSSTSVDALDYKNLFPLYFFDVPKQSERLNQGVVDISVQMNFSANAAANTKAYALLISDRYIKFQSDGRKMSVVFQMEMELLQTIADNTEAKDSFYVISDEIKIFFEN